MFIQEPKARQTDLHTQTTPRLRGRRNAEMYLLHGWGLGYVKWIPLGKTWNCMHTGCNKGNTSQQNLIKHGEKTYNYMETHVAI